MGDERESQRSPALILPYTLALMAVTVCVRVAPYWFDVGLDARWFWNLAPAGALGLFAGARLRSRWAFLVPLAAMLIADLLLIRPLTARGLPAFSMWTPLLYFCFALYALLGRQVRTTRSPLWLGGAAVLGSLQFFLLTNFACWLSYPGYAKNLGGLVECYTKALPFYGNTLAGDLLYTGLFFGLYAVAVFVVERQKASQPA